MQVERGGSEWLFGLFSEYEAPHPRTGEPTRFPFLDNSVVDNRKTFHGTAEEARKKTEELGRPVQRYQEDCEDGRICFGVLEADLGRAT